MKPAQLLLAFLLCIPMVYSQQKMYTLEECLALAYEYNPDLKSELLQARTAEVSQSRNWEEVLPGVNANYNLGYTDGRSIDPFTNDYINQSLTFSNASLQLNLTVFNGFRLMHQLKQGKRAVEAAEMEVEEARQNLGLRITLAYLQVLNARAEIGLAQARAETTRGQVDRLAVLYREEVGNPADYTDMQGQLANDRVAIVTAQNNYREAVIELFRLIGTEEESNAAFAEVTEGEQAQLYTYSAEEVYNEALGNLAVFRAKELRLESAESAVKAARAGYVPQLSVFGQLNTNYSSAAQIFNEAGTEVNATNSFVEYNGQQLQVLSNDVIFEGNDISYSDQFENNFNSVVGLALNIPVFNGFRNRNNVREQKIALQETEIDQSNTRFQFKQAIEQAHVNMVAAYERYEVLQEQVEVYEESFRINEIRFNSGVSNIVEYITAKNNLDASRLNLTNAMYEYVLRVRVLDFYRGQS